MIVYFHRHPTTNQVFYVGIGANKERAYRFQLGKRNKFWNNYVKKHGFPVVEIVHEVETRKEAVDLELMYIAKFGRRVDGSGCLVNITIGGDGGSLGVSKTDMQKKMISTKLKGYKHSEQSKANFKAAQNRPEVKEKQKQIKSSPEWLLKQKNAKLGGKLSNEHKESISLSLIGHAVTNETKEKISQKNKGKVRNQEQRDNISKAKKGVKRSINAVNKAAESNKKIILDVYTGIYYTGLKEAANAININLNTLRVKMSGHSKNNTPFIYV